MKTQLLSIILILISSLVSVAQDTIPASKQTLGKDSLTFVTIRLTNNKVIEGELLERRAKTLIVLNEQTKAKTSVPFNTVKSIKKIRKARYDIAIVDTSPHPVTIELNDGSMLRVEKLEKRNDSLVLFSQQLGKITLPISQIKTIDESPFVKTTQVENVFSDRIFLSPTAINLKKGEVQYTNYAVLLNQISKGVTDNFSMGGGCVILPISSLWFYTNAKLTYPIGKLVHVGVVALGAAGIPIGRNGNNDGGMVPVGVGCGLLTFGDRKNNFTIGIGKGLISGGRIGGVLSVGFQLRASNQFSVVSENYITQKIKVLSLGGKYLTSKIAINFGLTTFGGGAVLPIFGVTVPIKKKIVSQ